MLWIVMLCLLWSPQERIESGRFKGFSKSPTEHMIEDFDRMPVVRRFEGTVVIKERNEPMEGVLVELRGPGEGKAVTGVRTNKRGAFRFGSVPEGLYAFKMTKNGFRSIVGQVEIKRSAKKHVPLRFEMLFGV